MSLSPSGGERRHVFISSHKVLTKTHLSITHSPKSSSWKRVGWTSWSYGRLGSRPEDKNTFMTAYPTKK